MNQIAVAAADGGAVGVAGFFGSPYIFPLPSFGLGCDRVCQGRVYAVGHACRLRPRAGLGEGDRIFDLDLAALADFVQLGLIGAAWLSSLAS